MTFIPLFVHLIIHAFVCVFRSRAALCTPSFVNCLFRAVLCAAASPHVGQSDQKRFHDGNGDANVKDKKTSMALALSAHTHWVQFGVSCQCMLAHMTRVRHA